MEAWEYRFVDLHRGSHQEQPSPSASAAVLDELNLLGAAGWEVVAPVDIHWTKTGGLHTTYPFVSQLLLRRRRPNASPGEGFT